MSAEHDGCGPERATPTYPVAVRTQCREWEPLFTPGEKRCLFFLLCFVTVAVFLYVSADYVHLERDSSKILYLKVKMTSWWGLDLRRVLRVLQDLKVST